MGCETVAAIASGRLAGAEGVGCVRTALAVPYFACKLGGEGRMEFVVGAESVLVPRKGIDRPLVVYMATSPGPGLVP